MVSNDGKSIAVRREKDQTDMIGTFEAGYYLIRAHMPKLDSVILTAAGQRFFIRRKAKSPDNRLMIGHVFEGFLHVRRIPKFDAVRAAARSDAISGRRDRHGA